jgi:peptide-methionine (S)-S-oxide reductase
MVSSLFRSPLRSLFLSHSQPPPPQQPNEIPACLHTYTNKQTNKQTNIQKQMPGVSRVVAGYTGGTDPCPSFQNPQDHSEALLIEYNPQQVSYLELLQMWRDNDDPWEPEDLLRHRSAIFATCASQAQTARIFLETLVSESSLSSQQQQQNNDNKQQLFLYSTVEVATVFYRAEEAYQNYVQKQQQAAKHQVIGWATFETHSGLFAIAE